MTVAVAVLLGLAGVVAVACTLGALLVRDVAGRLHLVTPVTSVAGPAVGVAAALTLGWSASTAGALLVVGLLAVTSPVLTTGIAHAATRTPEPDTDAAVPRGPGGVS